MADPDNWNFGLGIFGSSVLTTLAQHDINIIASDDHEGAESIIEPVLVAGDLFGDITDEGNSCSQE